jgi:hypothetical protein
LYARVWIEEEVVDEPDKIGTYLRKSVDVGMKNRTHKGYFYVTDETTVGYDITTLRYRCSQRPWVWQIKALDLSVLDVFVEDSTQVFLVLTRQTDFNPISIILSILQVRSKRFQC